MALLKKIVAAVISSSVVLSIVPAFAASAALPEITSKAAAVIDCNTGKMIYEYNADEPLAPASMTKVMTVYIAYRKMDEGLLDKNTIIYADAEDAADSHDPVATNVILEEGRGYTVDELIKAIMVPSACAASEMLGKYISGSKEEFAALMNEMVWELGLEAYYDDASGLSDNNRITARSMAELSYRLLLEYPDVLNYTSMSSINIGGNTYRTTNRMLKGGAYEYDGADGIKTGTTTLAGSCFAGTAARYGNRLVSVTMHSEYSAARFEDTIEMMNYGFERLDHLYNNILTTDTRVFINGNEVPALMYGGPGEGVCFLVEDLNNYGFDIGWDESTSTVTAIYNSDKAVMPIPMDYYHTLLPDNVFMPISVGRNVNVVVDIDGKDFNIKNVFPLDGYTAISADEFIKGARSCVWNGAEKRLDITI